MIRVHTTLLALACFMIGPGAAVAQVPPTVMLQVDVENVVQYVDDTTDSASVATVQGLTVGAAPLNFRKFIILGDIVAVNGKPAKGALVENSRAITLRPNPTPGQAIADINRNNLTEFGFEILSADGSTQIGTVVGIAMGNGPAPPGVPLQVTQGNNAITGGTGAFLGAHGQMGQFTAAAGTSTQRVASMTEDPAKRRVNGGAKQTYILHIIPASWPQIVTTADGPAVTHAGDFTVVSASKPAAAGEILSLFATGLGPTGAAIDPGQPFPSSPLAAVTSPVEVKVNGESAEVLAAIGVPGTVGGYQVNFRVPADAAKGLATVQVTAAWIPGAPVSIAVQ